MTGKRARPRGRFTIARVRGVPVNLHWTFILLLGLVGFAIYSSSASVRVTLYGLGMFAGIFVFVLFHELAHVATARRFGVRTREITLHPLGGISMMERVPEKPRQEALVAVAGPLVNLGFAVLLIPVVLYFHNVSDLFSPKLLDLERPTLVLDLFWLNIIMGAFNLLPAFPLDGGRVMRASLALRMPYPRATKIAANLGRFFGIFLALYGLFGNFWFLLLGIFIYFGAAAEEKIALTMSVFEQGTVSEAMRRTFYTVRPDLSVRELMDMRYQTQQADVPVVEGGVFLGIVDRSAFTPERVEAAKAASDLMTTDPPALAPDDDLGAAFRKFTGAELKALPVLAPGEGPRRILGLVAIEDMERTYLTLTQKARNDLDPRKAAVPAPAHTGPAPAASSARVVRGDEHGADAERWHPVGR